MEKKVDNYKSKKVEINEKIFSIEKRPISDILKNVISNISANNETWIVTSDLKILDIFAHFGTSNESNLYSLFETFSVALNNWYYFGYSTYYPKSTFISCPCMYQTSFSERRLPIIHIMYNIFDKFEGNFIDSISNNLLFNEIKNDRDNKHMAKRVRKRIQAEWENHILDNYYNDF